MAQWTQKWWPRSPQNFVRTVYPTSRGPKSFVRTENLRCRHQRSFLFGLSSKVAAIFENFVRTPESYLLAAFSGVLTRLPHPSKKTLRGKSSSITYTTH